MKRIIETKIILKNNKKKWRPEPTLINGAKLKSQTSRIYYKEDL
jgi:hypothetical protein